MKDKKISIIGLGLIGGSLAKALQERLGIRDITAVNRSRESLDQALGEGVIARGFQEVNEYVWNSDIIFICTPVSKTIEYLELLAARVKPGCILTDVSSTKAEIVEYVDNMKNPPCFVGAHPMAGTEKTGYSAGFAHLFENAYYILTPGRSSNPEAVDILDRLIAGIGAIPVILDAREHDRITGCISHVPHIIASALVNMVARLDTSDGKMRMLAAGGFKDITRIASSSPEIWESIVLSNRLQIIDELEVYTNILDNVKKDISDNDSSKLYDFFKTARDCRNRFSDSRQGSILRAHEIVADVVDKPGIIGEIATLLGCNGINIKNINVSNSREFEQGCLVITLPDAVSVDNSFDLLEENGYKVYKR